MIRGRRGNDTITVDSSIALRASLLGLKGNDIIHAGSGNTLLSGGLGDDTLVGGSGDDTVDGGDGTDNCTADGGTNMTVGCEAISTRSVERSLPGSVVTLETGAVDSLLDSPELTAWVRTERLLGPRL